MPGMQCSDFQDLLGPWMDGERAPETEAHLRTCGACRELLADLEEIRVTGQAFGEVDPPPRVWTAIRAHSRMRTWLALAAGEVGCLHSARLGGRVRRSRVQRSRFWSLELSCSASKRGITTIR